MHTFAFMAFYESISEQYDFIFPLNPAQIDFVTGRLAATKHKNILDVGCGTGNLCLALAPHFKVIHGIDPDVIMLDIATEKAGKNHPNLQFSPYGMLDIETRFSDLDAILCFGNTLVHLSTEEEILQFFRQSEKALKPGGKLLVQIINYDRILDQDIKGLPTIENDKISFERNYNILIEKNIIEFETILSIKESGKRIQNLIHLYPIRRSSLDGLLIEAGFKEVSYYGNFKMESLTSTSVPLVFEASI